MSEAAASGEARATPGEVVIAASGVAKSYPSGEDVLEVLTATDLEIRAGERIAVLGASGIGKSTLLHLLGGLDHPDAGSIAFRGRALDSMSEGELATYRNHEVGFVFQFFQLLPEFTALENVMMPLLVGREREGVRERAHDLLEQVGLQARSHHYPSQLSGGERQRVAIARALVRGPSLVLADEPTGNLDVDTGLRVMEVFARLQRERGAAIVMATHNPALIGGFDRVLHMQPGGALQPATPG
jgi:lipoprotein-releasing system ATP-binding protein